MKTLNKLGLAGVLVLLTASLGAAPATTTTETPIGKANKASSLMGMDVRNPQNEKLGDIKDLVVDLHTGKIGYAVLSVGGFLGIGDKYIAVPPSAFTVATDERHLVLNADKAKVQSAPGFAKTDWPDLNSPSWTAHQSFWLPGGTAAGTVGTVTSGRETGTSAMVHGRVTAVDHLTKTFTVESTGGKDHQFKLADRATVTLNNNQSETFSDIKVGDHVAVSYRHENGTDVAERITESTSNK